ncbi:MAG: hypothetical protein D6780_05350 [Candidatus Dadabacteria bacterium]|nr:MAG: hypothetical protein D6780_05350 [Candidatus Dadabacteria bacterium]
MVKEIRFSMASERGVGDRNWGSREFRSLGNRLGFGVDRKLSGKETHCRLTIADCQWRNIYSLWGNRWIVNS